MLSLIFEEGGVFVNKYLVCCTVCIRGIGEPDSEQFFTLEVSASNETDACWQLLDEITYVIDPNVRFAYVYAKLLD